MKNQKIGLFKIVKRSFLWLICAILLVIWSLGLFFINFKPSIEFTGGIQMDIQNIQNIDTLWSSITSTLTNEWFENPQISLEQKDNSTNLLVSLAFENDDQVKEVSENIRKLLIEKKYISTEEDIIGAALNGPSVSAYMESSTINALIAWIVLIAIYMMFSFVAMRKHISPLILAAVTVATMIFDLAIPAGAYAIWMAFDPTVTVNTTFILAILTIMGYSINDTIIILDRIRENTIKHKDQLEKGTMMYGTLIESSVWQTMRRSMWTAFTTFLVVVAMFVFGASVMREFAFTMGVGVIAGSLSSIFVASPLVYLLLNKWKKELPKL